MVNSMLKKLKDISVEYMECLNKDVKNKKQDSSCILGGKDDQISTGAKLLGNTHKCYGFSADVIETTNQ